MDLGQLLTSAAPTYASQPAFPTYNTQPYPGPQYNIQPAPAPGGYSNWMLRQSQMRPPTPKAFSIPLTFRPNRTAPNKLTATPNPGMGQAAAGVGLSAAPAPAAPGAVPTTPTYNSQPAPPPTPAPVKAMSTPFGDYRGKTIGSPVGHLGNVAGFSS